LRRDAGRVPDRARDRERRLQGERARSARPLAQEPPRPGVPDVRAARWIAAALLAAPLAVLAFGFEDVDRRAAELAKKSYEPYKNDLPSALRNLTYDQYRDIRFKNDHALWRTEKLPFEVAFFHRGGQFVEPVRLNEIAGA